MAATVVTHRSKNRVYSLVTVTGTLNGTSPQVDTFDIPMPVFGGSIEVVGSGATNGVIVTCTFYKVGPGINLVSAADTVGADQSINLHAGVMEELANATNHRVALSAGSYSVRMVGGAATGGTYTVTLLLEH